VRVIKQMSEEANRVGRPLPCATNSAPLPPPITSDFVLSSAIVIFSQLIDPDIL